MSPGRCVACLVFSRLKLLSEAEVADYPSILRKLADLAERRSRTEAFVESFRLVAEAVGRRDPYGEAKAAYNMAALRALSPTDLEGLSCERLLAVMASSNSVDVEMPGYETGPEELLKALTVREAASFGSGASKACSALSEARVVSLVLDNAGEAVIDLLALARLARGRRAIVVARGEPYELDVTVEEVLRLVPEGLNATVLSTNGPYPVFHPSSRTALERVLAADAILVKGIANLESFLENPVPEAASRIVFLLRAKCQPIAELLGVGLRVPVVVMGDMLLRLREGLKKW